MTKKYTKWFLFPLATFLLLVISAMVSLSTGVADISLSNIFSILQHGEGMEYFILTQIRIPRTLLAIAVGGSLGLAGAILQGIFRNPLVEPYTLGISGGAALGVAIAIVAGLQITLGVFILPMAGFAGAIITILLVSLLGFFRGGADINRMLLIGVMISFLASSLVMLLISLTARENMHGIIFWIMGSLDEPNPMLIHIAVIASILGLVFSYFFTHSLNALRLGETKASSLGINSKYSIRLLFVFSSLLAGICVAVAGVIGFVGLIVPHIVRMMVGSDYRILLIGSFLGGGVFLIISDIIARTIIAPNELPIGVITGITGGILFIAVMTNLKKRRKHEI